MSCGISLERLSEYLLRAEQGTPDRLSGHVAGCKECMSRLDLLQETARLTNSAEMEQPPDDLWSGIQGRLASRSRRRSLPLRRVWTLAAATAVVLLVVALQIVRTPTEQLEAAQYLERHSALLPVEAATAVSPDEFAGFSSDLSFNIRRPAYLPTGWKLVKLDRFTCRQGQPVAHLMYQNGQQTLSVFQKPDGGQGRGSWRGRGGGRGMGPGRQGRGGGGGMGFGRLVRVQGQAVAYAAGNGIRVFAAGDLPADQLQKVAESVVTGVQIEDVSEIGGMQTVVNRPEH